jgi:hypothetical protein
MRSFILGLVIFLSVFALSAQEAVIREFTGTVEIKKPGTAWTPAQPGQKISRDTIISTGFKSTAIIDLGNSVLTVRPLTRLSLEELRSAREDETTGLYLQTGRIRAEVSPPSGGKTSFSVRTPAITASVRGTSFAFDGINLKVDRGLVHVGGRNISGVYVRAGQRAVLNLQRGTIASPAQTAREDLTPNLPVGAQESSPRRAARIPAGVVDIIIQ